LTELHDRDQTQRLSELANGAARMVIDPAFTVAEVDESVFGSFGPSALTRRSALAACSRTRPARLSTATTLDTIVPEMPVSRAISVRPAWPEARRAPIIADVVLLSKLLE
jgi:hypothetical protein